MWNGAVMSREVNGNNTQNDDAGTARGLTADSTTESLASVYGGKPKHLDGLYCR